MAKNKKDIDNCDLDELREEFIKKYGEGVVRFDVDEVISNVEAVPTNIISIDAAFGIGGVPRGRIIEIFGPESSGKTTTCLQIAAAFQNTDFNGRKGRVAFVDAEHALDPQWAKKIGCNPEDFIFTQPEHGEQAYDIIEMIVKSGKVELIILDSIAALSTKDEVEGEITDQSIGAQARMNSKALKRIKGILSDNKVTLICCNQIREKIGVMFGSPEVTPGGRALKFYASVRIDVRRTGKYKVGENVVGASTKASFVKNKIAAPFKEALYNICYGEESYPIYGIDPYGNLIESAIEHKILHKSGNFIKYGEESLGNGLTNAATAIRLDPNLFKEIYTKTLEKIKPCHTPHQLTSQEVSST